jgi:hypothetical protein
LFRLLLRRMRNLRLRMRSRLLRLFLLRFLSLSRSLRSLAVLRRRRHTFI